MEQIFDLAKLVEEIFSSAGIDYRIVGGLAVYLCVEQVEPDAGRLTKDIDIAVRREDLDRIAEAAKLFGMELRHVAGDDILIRSDQSSARRAVHLLFSGEKVRTETPSFGVATAMRGLRLIPLADLVRMKLTSFRAKDEAHIKDLDEAGLLTPEFEESLPNSQSVWPKLVSGNKRSWQLSKTRVTAGQAAKMNPNPIQKPATRPRNPQRPETLSTPSESDLENSRVYKKTKPPD